MQNNQLPTKTLVELEDHFILLCQRENKHTYMWQWWSRTLIKVFAPKGIYVKQSLVHSGQRKTTYLFILYNILEGHLKVDNKAIK
jgi:hypothetical protein